MKQKGFTPSLDCRRGGPRSEEPGPRSIQVYSWGSRDGVPTVGGPIPPPDRGSSSERWVTPRVRGGDRGGRV